MYLRKRTVLKYLTGLTLGLVLYCEWFIYIAQPLFWNKLTCDNSIKNDRCTKILFISDPQIQGDNAVPSPIGDILNWDSDRYLQSTYRVVMKQFKPDIIVFMGDLMDEGSVATIQQFHGYVKRLSNIFDTSYPVVQIWIPGDNDIGGENEVVKPDKVLEFNKVFSQPSVISYNNISFYKVNAITHSIPQPLDEGDLNYKIAISHFPVLTRTAYAKKVINALQPDIFFCAHDHVSKYVQHQHDFVKSRTHLLQYKDPVLVLPLENNESIYEIYTPTCSYRMGTFKIGFGAAVIDNDHLKYTVFWSPLRFPCLFVYLLLSIIVFGYTLFICFMRLFSRLCHHLPDSEDTKRLLPQV
ncbi:uncharacterized protein LOC126969192 [Leptidea sinapis]|uniref:Calcineurin-like phosphoesterase domain-containing protein n=1 Tax=Leptidea sinapis TaxID=189913 RepID=A0A5E4QY80_9NEOP|nr:uncharacterized protein LOC126969192 [Leptidea sinapis]VVD01938.1 unnamed protein product [Leptidea sinapis]